MESRRNFIKKTGLFSTGLLVFSDPFIAGLANIFGEDPEEYAGKFSHVCDYSRETDLLNFRFYFVNLKVYSKNLVRTQEGDREKSNAYMIVRIPQQHIAEQYKKTDQLKKLDTLSRAFIAGYSYLTFRLKNEEDLQYTPNTLLDWSKFDLITLDDLKDLNKLSASTFKSYPNDLLNNTDHQIFFTAGGVKIPVTIFEAPYKLFLSPIAPTLRGKRGRTDLGYLFSNSLNKVVSFFRSRDASKKIDTHLIEPWNNSLNYHVNYLDQNVALPASFKAIAYQKEEEDPDIFPTERDRTEIVEHTLLDFETGLRDINSNRFTIGALGVTTHLHYKNLFAKKNSSFVEWQQKIRNGRDNYVEVVRLGIDIRSGKKVLVSSIAERIIQDGRSVLVMRLFLSFLETEKEYQIADFPYTKSVTRNKGFFFSYVPLTGTDPNQLKVKVDFKGVSEPFIPVEEAITMGTAFNTDVVKKGIIKLEYSKFDRQGNEKQFKSHLAIVFKEHFENGSVDNYLDNHRALTAHKDLVAALREDTVKEKIAFVRPEQSESTSVNRNTYLTTDYFQFESRKASPDFYSVNPISQHLIYAKIAPPQVEGFANMEGNHFEYSAFFKKSNEVLELTAFIDKYKTSSSEVFTYLKDGVKKMVNNAVTLQEAIAFRDEKKELSAFYKSNRVFFNSIASDIETSFIPKKKDIEGVFTKNLQKIGNLINPDPMISGLSELEQGVTMAENTAIETVKKIKNASDEAGLKTVDFLKGLNAELFNGINLKDILRAVLPASQTPIFEVIDKAEEGIKLISEYTQKFTELQKQVRDLPDEIERQRKKLYTTLRSPLEEYYDKKLLLEQKRLEILIEKQLITPLEKKIAGAVQTFSTAANELKDLTKDSTVATVKAAFELLSDKPEAYLLAAVSKIKSKAILQSVLAIKELTADNKYKAIARVLAVSLSYDKTFSKEAQKAFKEVAVELIDLNADSQIADVITAFKKIQAKDEKYIVAAVLNVETRIRESIDSRSKLFSNADKATYQKIIDLIEHVQIESREEDLIISELRVLTDQASKDIRNEITKYVNHEKKVRYQYMIRYSKQLQEQYKDLKLGDADIKTELDKLARELDLSLRAIVFDAQTLPTFSEHLQKYSDLAENLLKDIGTFQTAVEGLRGEIQAQINKLNGELAKAKYEIENFIKLRLEEKRKELEAAQAELTAAYEHGKEQVKLAQEKVAEVEKIMRKLLECNQKSFKYTWRIEPDNFSNFKNALVSFYKTDNTSLDVFVKTDVNYKLSLDRPPQFMGTDVYSKNRIQNFKIVFLDVLAIDFAEVTFESGTQIESDFDVKINNIYFSGALTFISAFQTFMQGLNFLKNLITEGVIVDCKIPIPDISAGAFNFCNAKLYAAVFLPIGSRNPIRLDFGFNTPDDMFLVSYGIFGGRGCFQIGLTPKEGVVMILFVIEVGGVVLLNIGVAKGCAYLFAGFYFRKQNNVVLIKAYLVAGGSFRIAGLITAGLTFYMGLEGDGRILKGKCYVQYSFKIGFVEFSFRMTFEKKIAGASADQSRSERLRAEALSLGVAVPDELDETSEPKVTMDRAIWKKHLKSYKKI